MSTESLRRRLNRLKLKKRDQGIAARLAAARSAHLQRRADRVAQGLSADLSADEKAQQLRDKLAAQSVDGLGLECADQSDLGQRIFAANRRMLAYIESRGSGVLQVDATR